VAIIIYYVFNLFLSRVLFNRATPAKPPQAEHFVIASPTNRMMYTVNIRLCLVNLRNDSNRTCN